MPDPMTRLREIAADPGGHRIRSTARAVTESRTGQPLPAFRAMTDAERKALSQAAVEIVLLGRGRP